MPPTAALPTDSHANSSRAGSHSSSRAEAPRPSARQAARSGGRVTTEIRLAIAGGGTGGHLVPGINVCLRASRSARSCAGPPLADVVWLSSGRSIEERLLGGLEAKIEPVPLERAVLSLEPKGGGAPSRAGLVLRTAPAVVAARRVLAAHGSNVLLGLGGFTCLPAVLAARSLGLPVGSRDAASASGSSVHEFVGPPLAPEFDGREISSAEQSAARVELGFEPDRPLLLVLGGSQGATGINRFVRSYAPALVGSGVQILHQTGPGKLDEGCEPFSGYRAVEFLLPAHRALCAATAVLCRGGASTLAEVAAVGRPAVVVPYPHHADRHQEKNALELGEGVRVIHEEKLSAGLRADLERLCSPAGENDRWRMTRALKAAVPTDGAQRLAATLGALACPALAHSEGSLS